MESHVYKHNKEVLIKHGLSEEEANMFLKMDSLFAHQCLHMLQPLLELFPEPSRRILAMVLAHNLIFHLEALSDQLEEGQEESHNIN